MLGDTVDDVAVSSGRLGINPFSENTCWAGSLGAGDVRYGGLRLDKLSENDFDLGVLGAHDRLKQFRGSGFGAFYPGRTVHGVTRRFARKGRTTGFCGWCIAGSPVYLCATWFKAPSLRKPRNML